MAPITRTLELSVRSGFFGYDSIEVFCLLKRAARRSCKSDTNSGAVIRLIRNTIS